jgi:hypothetical protein
MSDMTVEEFFDFHRLPDEVPEHGKDSYLETKESYDKFRKWALDRDKTMQECWLNVSNFGWLLCMAVHPGVLTAKEKAQFGLYCCEMVRHHLTDFRAIAAISLYRRWVESGISEEELELAGWAAGNFWEEEDNHAATWAGCTVAAAVNYSHRSKDAAPDILEVADAATKAGVNPVRLIHWFRVRTKPNFTKKEG